MPRRPRKTLPTYRHHRPSGQAVVTLSNQDHYLGPYGTDVSRREYDRVVEEWLARGRQPATRGEQSDLTVNELLLAYWKFAEGHYVSGGKPLAHLANVRYALKPVKALYGHTRATEFDAVALRTVRKAMIKAGLCLNTINGRMSKIRSMFRWAVDEKLYPATLLHELSRVKALAPDRDDVRCTDPVEAVPDEHVAAVLPLVPAPVRAMIELQRLTGMRPGEVVLMRGAEIDRSEDVWLFRPRRHKSARLGRARPIFLGKRAQEILVPWLKDDPHAFLFSPAAAVEARNASRRAARKTPMTPSQRARKRKPDPKRPPRDRYNRHAYAQAIARACDKAGVPRWGPNRLRHALGTQVRRRFGLEASQVVLGHVRADVTQIYATRDMDKAREIMREVG